MCVCHFFHSPLSHTRQSESVQVKAVDGKFLLPFPRGSEVLCQWVCLCLFFDTLLLTALAQLLFEWASSQVSRAAVNNTIQSSSVVSKSDKGWEEEGVEGKKAEITRLLTLHIKCEGKVSNFFLARPGLFLRRLCFHLLCRASRAQCCLRSSCRKGYTLHLVEKEGKKNTPASVSP